METSIAILASNDTYKSEIQNALELSGARCELYATINDLENALRKEPFHGLVVDVLSKSKAGNQEDLKRLIEVMEIFPTAQVKWDSRSKTIRTLLMVQNGGDDSLDFFVNNVCRNSEMRMLRANRRYEYHFNLLISDNPHALEQGNKSVTVDISKGGCYTASFEPLPVNQEVYIQFKELDDKTPIKAATIWSINWGEEMKFPGNGLKFVQITEAQTAELRKWIG